MLFYDCSFRTIILTFFLYIYNLLNWHRTILYSEYKLYLSFKAICCWFSKEDKMALEIRKNDLSKFPLILSVIKLDGQLLWRKYSSQWWYFPSAMIVASFHHLISIKFIKFHLPVKSLMISICAKNSYNNKDSCDICATKTITSKII